MSDIFEPDDWPPDDRDDLLAAEYVLGVLSGDERRSAQTRSETDGAFAERVAHWERRLALLNAAYEEGPVDPGTLEKVEAALFGEPAATPEPALATRRQGAGWRLWFAGALSAAVVVLAVLFWPQPTAAPLVARLDAGELAFDASYQAGVLQVAHRGPEAEEGRDYELWSIGADGVPRSLGILRGEAIEIPAELDAGVTLAVSLEPLGGSPDAGPTGPVLMTAELTLGD
ncbi:anti-sigma factor [Pararhodobacter marinus]|uniref:Anti-sigma factor n=1 Tax=Pararhodobacter marinus TaxID=2184063 RepID=A0A2U2C3Y6_9RHOB|nr:anti-sigma factor [Pararhodobacter marinus]PWE26600.1 anti-sigma factor [Pararhodobacter marinus]|eukprot:m.16130 g.16130  ORF g.16130 m.16130 type:complete len:229 (-) comp8012_c0_seq1:8-694(-)